MSEPKGRSAHAFITQANVAKIQAVLTPEWQTATKIAKRAKLTQPTTSKLLGNMIDVMGRTAGVEAKFERPEGKNASSKRRYLYRLKVDGAQPV